MCGFAGILAPAGRSLPPALIAAIGQAIAHRGPDDRGFGGWRGGDDHPELTRAADRLTGCRYLGVHQRLSIIDTGEGGWQPMASDDGRHMLLFNGEIYNYLELRAELEALGVRFHSRSDTEVLLKAWLAWGPKLLPRLTGMFAFALLDTVERRLVLARDPFGIKPLYWAEAEGLLLFGSEIKALAQAPGLSRKVDAAALYDYLRLGFTDAGEATLFSAVRRLPAAHYAVLDIDKPVVRPQRYWAIDLNRKLDLSFDEAAAHLRGLFTQSVGLHLRADVPVGVALSGGIDSSAVAMCMRQLQGPSLELHAFSFVASEARLSEEKWIDIAGKEAGATIHKICLSPEELAADIDHVIAAQDEPFGSTSIFAQYHVYKTARAAGIKVTLDGQGADELLAGYPNYYAARLASLIRKGKLIEAQAFFRAAAARAGFGGKGIALRAGRYLLPAGLQGLARKLVGEDLSPDWLNDVWFAAKGVRPSAPVTQDHPDLLRAELLATLEQRSLPALLRYCDRNSMAHAVESRVPFLTTAIADFVYALPEDFLIDRQGSSKAVLRAALRGIAPDAILDRKDKIGFATPESQWLRVLSPWVEASLNSPTARALSPLNHAAMLTRWQAEKASGKSLSSQLWRWVNLIRWAEANNADFS